MYHVTVRGNEQKAIYGDDTVVPTTPIANASDSYVYGSGIQSARRMIWS